MDDVLTGDEMIDIAARVLQKVTALKMRRS